MKSRLMLLGLLMTASCIVQSEPGPQGTAGPKGADGMPGSIGPQGPPGPAGTSDASMVILNGTAPQSASFNISGTANVGTSISLAGLDVTRMFPFYRVSRNQVLSGTRTGIDDEIAAWERNSNCGVVFQFVQTVTSDKGWADRTAEEQALLTAMGRPNIKYLFEEFAIYRIAWTNGPCNGIMRQITPASPSVTTAAFTKLESGSVDGAWAKGIQPAWTLTGETYTADQFPYGYTWADPSTDSATGALLVAMPANVIGRVQLADPMNWGWFPFADPHPSPNEGICPDPLAPSKYGFCIWHYGTYDKTYKEAAALCRAQGGRLCTLAEVSAAQAAGANWCTEGWVADRQNNSTAYTSFPVQTASPACCNEIGTCDVPYPMSSLHGANCCRP